MPKRPSSASKSVVLYEAPVEKIEVEPIPGSGFARANARSRQETPHLRSAKDVPLPNLAHLNSSTLFMKRRSLIAQLLRLRADLGKAEHDLGHQYTHLIGQIERVLLDIRARRISQLLLPGAYNARVFLLPD